MKKQHQSNETVLRGQQERMQEWQREQKKGVGAGK